MSFNKNFVNLNDFKNKFDIIAWTEAWLSEDCPGELLCGYEFFRTKQKINQNDGVVMLVKSELSAMAVEVNIGGVIGLELTFVRAGRPCRVLAVYRTHDSNPLLFTDSLATYYRHLDRNCTAVFLGDINLDILNPNNVIDYYLNTLYSLGFVKCISKPTRETGNSSTCLDHIFIRTNDISKVKAAVIKVNITDHFTVMMTLKLKTLPQCADTRSNRKTFTMVDKNILRDNLVKENWDVVLKEDVNESASNFFTILSSAVSKSTIQVSIKPRLDNLKPWITPAIVRSIRERDKLSKLTKKQPFNIDLNNRFRMYRNTLSNIIKQTKINYFKDNINKSLGNPKSFWKTVNEMAGRTKNKDSFNFHEFLNSTDVTDSTEQKFESVTNKFNQYFTEVGANLAKDIRDPNCADIVDDSNYSCDSRLTLHTVTEADVRRLVAALRGGSAPGYCGISAKFLKENIGVFINPLLHIINLSIAQGVFPEVFKIAKIFPLFKSGGKSEYKNYRPISLLSVFSKVLEKVIKEQLVRYLNENKIISDCQYGFRQGKNISNALFNLNAKLFDLINKNKKILLIFLDLAKAFDSLDRKKLLKKLNLMGIMGRSYDWFESYLGNRTQYVAIDKFKSNHLPIDYGVVQGSTLGPILFLIYINNLPKINISGKLFLFADDTALLVEANSWREVYQKASEDLTSLKIWFDQNILTLNVTKTKYLQISLREVKENENFDLKLHECDNANNDSCNCKILDKVSFYKYLGVIIDSKLRWADHISYLKKKIRKYIYFFSQAGAVLTPKEIRDVYCAYVQSLLEGGIVAWGGAYRTILEPLLTTQKCVIKVALKKKSTFLRRNFSRDECTRCASALYTKCAYLLIPKF